MNDSSSKLIPNEDGETQEELTRIEWLVVKALRDGQAETPSDRRVNEATSLLSGMARDILAGKSREDLKTWCDESQFDLMYLGANAMASAIQFLMQQWEDVH